MGPTSKVRNFILSPILRKKFLMKLPAFINQILHSFYGFQDNRVQRGEQGTNTQNNNCLAHLDKCQVFSRSEREILQLYLIDKVS
jgi:hypothetical protein